MSAVQKVPVHAWIVPGRLAIAERPGGGGRSQRVTRRHADLAWWRAQGVATIVSTMRSRHSVTEYARLGFGVRWYPLKDVVQAQEVSAYTDLGKNSQKYSLQVFIE